MLIAKRRIRMLVEYFLISLIIFLFLMSIVNSVTIEIQKRRKYNAIINVAVNEVIDRRKNELQNMQKIHRESGRRS